MADYYPLLANSISCLGKNTPETRDQLYEQARTTLVGLVSSDMERLREGLALEMAVIRIEEEVSAGRFKKTGNLMGNAGQHQDDVAASPVRASSVLQQCHDARKQAPQRQPAVKRASTLLLLISKLFPGQWALDLTSMSVYWVARRRAG